MHRCGTGLDQFRQRAFAELPGHDLVGAEAVKPVGFARRDRMGLGEGPGLRDHHAAAAAGAVGVPERTGGEQHALGLERGELVVMGLSSDRFAGFGAAAADIKTT